MFDLERRIYRIDRIRLNPGGIPVRGIVYFLVLLACAAAAVRLPLAGMAARTAPWYVRDVALPALAAALLTVVRLEGRPFHLAVRALLRFHFGPRSIAGLGRRPPRAERDPRPGEAWHPTSLLMLPDGSERGGRRLSYTGPGALRVGVAHERRDARGPLVWLGLRPHLRIRPIPDAPPLAPAEVVVLGRAIRLRVR
ncbi:MAG TPA: hypothetical protein VN817_05390 [Solirubrobacteraceae bacterium]|nr:hypothetical protein [Solirubrobacteraceae bacterium]